MSSLGMSIATKNFAKGLTAGREEGRINTLIELVNIGLISVKDAAKTAGITEDEFEKKLVTTSKMILYL